MAKKKISGTDLLVVLGPTASGKTKLAVQLAKKLNGEIISADSRQVYKGMDIGTGKDMNDYELNGEKILYHIIDIADPMEEYNVAQFQRDFFRAFSEIKGRNKLPILCGGTGFYIKAVIMDFQLPSAKPNKQLRHELETWKMEDLVKKLESIAPGISKQKPIDTKRRVIRAIEVQINMGNGEGIRSKINGKLSNYLIIGVEYSRQIIRERITIRLHNRLKSGMIEEVEFLLQNGVTHERLDSLGLEYRLISRYLKGEINKAEMASKLNTAIHRFAKKQMTFFRNMEKNGIKINWITKGNLESVLRVIKR